MQLFAISLTQVLLPISTIFYFRKNPFSKNVTAFHPCIWEKAAPKISEDINVIFCIQSMITPLKIVKSLHFECLKLHGLREICDWMEPLGEKDLDLRRQECHLDLGSSS